MTQRKTRRGFVRMVLMAQACGFLAACDRAQTKESRGNPAPSLASAALNPTDSAVVGRWYLEAHPREATPEALVESLLSAHPDLFSLADEHLPRALREAVQRDFESGDTLTLQGWILSRSEARIAAFVSLSQLEASSPPG